MYDVDEESCDSDEDDGQALKTIVAGGGRAGRQQQRVLPPLPPTLLESMGIAPAARTAGSRAMYRHAGLNGPADSTPSMRDLDRGDGARLPPVVCDAEEPCLMLDDHSSSRRSTDGHDSSRRSAPTKEQLRRHQHQRRPDTGASMPPLARHHHGQHSIKKSLMSSAFRLHMAC
jgi:hypothetical protein